MDGWPWLGASQCNIEYRLKINCKTKRAELSKKPKSFRVKKTRRKERNFGATFKFSFLISRWVWGQGLKARHLFTLRQKSQNFWFIWAMDFFKLLVKNKVVRNCKKGVIAWYFYTLLLHVIENFARNSNFASFCFYITQKIIYDFIRVELSVWKQQMASMMKINEFYETCQFLL